MSSALLKRQVRTFTGTSLTTSPQNFGAIVTITGQKVALVNTSDMDVTITDGSTSDAYYIPAGSTLSVGEGVAGYGQMQYANIISKAQSQYKITSPGGAATKGTIVLTVVGN